MKVFFWLFVLLLAAALALFAVSNREPVSLALWPLPFLLQLPLYLAVLLTLVIGFIIGSMAAWLGGSRTRREFRRRGRRITALERELKATQAQLAPALPADGRGEGRGAGRSVPPPVRLAVGG